jgi:hypothetical protein
MTLSSSSVLLATLVSPLSQISISNGPQTTTPVTPQPRAAGPSYPHVTATAPPPHNAPHLQSPCPLTLPWESSTS